VLASIDDLKRHLHEARLKSGAHKSRRYYQVYTCKRDAAAEAGPVRRPSGAASVAVGGSSSKLANATVSGRSLTYGGRVTISMECPRLLLSCWRQSSRRCAHLRLPSAPSQFHLPPPTPTDAGEPVSGCAALEVTRTRPVSQITVETGRHNLSCLRLVWPPIDVCSSSGD
jgi:hypothetical protein